jgi:hypothetical protein
MLQIDLLLVSFFLLLAVNKGMYPLSYVMRESTTVLFLYLENGKYMLVNISLNTNLFISGNVC